MSYQDKKDFLTYTGYIVDFEETKDPIFRNRSKENPNFHSVSKKKKKKKKATYLYARLDRE